MHRRASVVPPRRRGKPAPSPSAPPRERPVADPGRPRMSNLRVLLHFLIAIAMFLGVPVAISLFARLVMD